MQERGKEQEAEREYGGAMALLPLGGAGCQGHALSASPGRHLIARAAPVVPLSSM